MQFYIVYLKSFTVLLKKEKYKEKLTLVKQNLKGVIFVSYWC